MLNYIIEVLTLAQAHPVRKRAFLRFNVAGLKMEIMQHERVSTNIELPRDLYRRLNEIAARHGCSAQQVILQSIESAIGPAPRERPKKRLSLDEPLVPSTGGPINPTEEQIYGGIEFP